MQVGDTNWKNAVLLRCARKKPPCVSASVEMRLGRRAAVADAGAAAAGSGAGATAMRRTRLRPSRPKRSSPAPAGSISTLTVARTAAYRRKLVTSEKSSGGGGLSAVASSSARATCVAWYGWMSESNRSRCSSSGCTFHNV